jgi:general secretion pathway protein G
MRLPVLRRRVDGLTLIELLCAIAIIAVLSSIAIPSYQRYIERTKVSVAIADINEIMVRIERYHSINRSLPKDLGQIGRADLKDPWGNPYQYLNFEGLKGKGHMRKDKNMVPVNTDYDLYSMGPDGRTNQTFTAKAGRDDIVRANNGAYVGPASDY